MRGCNCRFHVDRRSLWRDAAQEHQEGSDSGLTAKDVLLYRFGDFSQAERMTHRGMLLVDTLDDFTRGDSVASLKNINSHMPTADENEPVFVERTGHTCQMKEQEVADVLLAIVSCWWKGE